MLHELKFFNVIIESPDDAVARLDDIGGPSSHANYPWGWAHAGNSPFKWYTQNTHEGGVHVPLVVHWPAGVPDAGGIRRQFHYVTDLAPTIYEVAGITPPEGDRGLEQMPVTGTSLAYTFGNADAPDAKTVQYFEMMGHRALYLDGWKAVTRHEHGVVPFDEDRWEFYHLAEDVSECTDLAAAEPARLAAMIARWWTEAEEHGVLPLDERTLELFGARPRERSPHPPSRHYTYRLPMSPLPAQVAPGLAGRSWDVLATVDRAAGQGEVLYASGNENSGLSIFVLDDHLMFDYDCFGDHHVVRSSRPVPEGLSVIGVEFRRARAHGEATLIIDGDACGRLTIPFVMRMISGAGTSVGRDHGSAVSKEYEGEFPFGGVLHQVDVQLVSLSERERTAAAEARTAMARQ